METEISWPEIIALRAEYRAKKAIVQELEDKADRLATELQTLNELTDRARAERNNVRQKLRDMLVRDL